MANLERVSTIEQRVIEQLTGYKDLVGRIRVLQTYSVGNGITVSRLNEDDHLQELHLKLKTMPTYMYLNGHEQNLEQRVSAYLTRHPSGISSQKRAVQECNTVDEEDEKALREVVQKIEKVIEARTGRRDDLDLVLEHVAEYQDLKAEKSRIDSILDVLKDQNPDYERLLQLHIIEGQPWVEVVKQLHTSKSVFYRLRRSAIAKYARLAGWENRGNLMGTEWEQKTF